MLLTCSSTGSDCAGFFFFPDAENQKNKNQKKTLAETLPPQISSGNFLVNEKLQYRYEQWYGLPK